MMPQQRAFEAEEPQELHCNRRHSQRQLHFGNAILLSRTEAITMNRRDWLKHSAVGMSASSLPLIAAAEGRAFPPPEGMGPAAAGDGRKLPPLRITDVRTIL